MTAWKDEAKRCITHVSGCLCTCMTLYQYLTNIDMKTKSREISKRLDVFRFPSNPKSSRGGPLQSPGMTRALYKILSNSLQEFMSNSEKMPAGAMQSGVNDLRSAPAPLQLSQLSLNPSDLIEGRGTLNYI